MYTTELPTTSFITISDPTEGFIDSLNELPDALLDLLNDLDIEVTITDIFPTSISITLEGYKEVIIEGVGLITQLLIEFNVYNFHFMFHTVEVMND